MDSEDLAEPEADSVRTVTAVTGIPAMEEKNSAVHISVAAQVASLISMKTNFFLGLRTGVERVQNRLTRRCWQICKAVSVISPGHRKGSCL